MRSNSLYAVFLFTIISQQALGQDYGFIDAKIRSIQPNGIIYYSDRPMMKIVDEFLARTKNGTIVGYFGKKFQLTKDEKTFILSKLKKQFQETLPDSMFRESKRIARDTIIYFVYKENKALMDTVVTKSGLKVPLYKTRHWAFSFTNPIYFRNSSWMIYYFRYYDNSGGVDGLYVCKKVNNQWTKWATLGGGAW